jgi:tRNA dimethylallyltransferase
MPVAQAHAALLVEDPVRAAALAPSDTTRVARALEVVRSTGQPLAAWHARQEGGIGSRVHVQAAILLPARPALYARCELRFERMVQRGALDEVRALLARNLDPDMPVMRAIGVPELAAFLRGESTMADAMAHAAQATRNYAKRQYTWLRHQPPPDWARLHFDDFTSASPEVILLRCFGLT